MGDAAPKPTNGIDESEVGPDSGPHRLCLVTRQVQSPDEMVRFVVGPDDRVVPDIRRKLPGRGVWITLSAKVLEEAVRKKAFARGFKKPVTVSATLVDDVDRLLEADALQALSLANKAGLVVAGSAKVESAVAKGEVRALLHATDGSADGARKLMQVVTRTLGDAKAPEVFEIFASSQLDLSLGRTNVIHAALGHGSASMGVMARCNRLVQFRRDLQVQEADKNKAPLAHSKPDAGQGST